MNPIWFIQTVYNSKQLLLPGEEFIIATLEGRIMCHSKGKSGLERASWLENLICPQFQSRPSKTKWLRTALWSQSAWTELYFPCFSPAFSVDGKMPPEQDGSREGKETQVLDKLSLRKWLLRPLARAYEYIPENSIFPVWTICILSNDGGYRASSLGIKTLDKKESDMSHLQEVWIITCFEHFWSTIFQRQSSSYILLFMWN